MGDPDADDTVPQRSGPFRRNTDGPGKPFAGGKQGLPVTPWKRRLALATGGAVIAATMLLLYSRLPPFSPAGVKTAPTSVAATVPEVATSPYALAGEAEILATRSDRLTVFRLDVHPEILVFDFPSLHEQARTLNRVAVMVETSGQSRDHALGDDALDQVVRAAGAEPDSFYDGHDYRAADVLRFFRATERDGIKLNAEEVRLRGILDKAGWFIPGNALPGALISIPTMGAGIDAVARAVVLHHEMSHGEFFTNPGYVEHTRRFWQNELTAAERAGFRRFLTGQQYDADNEDLMMNETQAYLIHTPDPRFFTPAMAGLTTDRAHQLREQFLATMPPGWLRDMALAAGPAAHDAR